MGDRAKKFTNVYVKNFGDALDDDKMRTLFETCGPITSSKVDVLSTLRTGGWCKNNGLIAAVSQQVATYFTR